MSQWAPAQLLLDQHLRAFPGLGSMPVAWPNRKFTKPTPAKPYLRPSFLPERVDASLGVGGSRHEAGTYQLDVFAPADDSKGNIPALEMVDALSAHFDAASLSGFGLRLQCSVPYPAPMLQEPGWVQYPISIRFSVL